MESQLHVQIRYLHRNTFAQCMLSENIYTQKSSITCTYAVLYLENVSRGAKLRFQEIRGQGAGIQLFLMIYAILIDIRLDKFPRGSEKKQAPPKCAPDTYVYIELAMATHNGSIDAPVDHSVAVTSEDTTAWPS